VVFARGRFDQLPREVRRLVTQWGIDPVWPSSIDLAFPAVGSPSDPAATKENITIPVPKPDGGPAGVPLPATPG
jgi:hypothetical protein